MLLTLFSGVVTVYTTSEGQFDIEQILSSFLHTRISSATWLKKVFTTLVYCDGTPTHIGKYRWELWAHHLSGIWKERKIGLVSTARGQKGAIFDSSEVFIWFKVSGWSATASQIHADKHRPEGTTLLLPRYSDLILYFSSIAYFFTQPSSILIALTCYVWWRGLTNQFRWAILGLPCIFTRLPLFLLSLSLFLFPHRHLI